MPPGPRRVREAVQAHGQWFRVVGEVTGGQVAERESGGLHRPLGDRRVGAPRHAGQANRPGSPAVLPGGLAVELRPGHQIADPWAVAKALSARPRPVIVVTPSAWQRALWVTSPERSWRDQGNSC